MQNSLIEALTLQQQKHAFALTHSAQYINDDDSEELPSDISDEWKKERTAFLNKFPLSKKMFSENGDTKEYTIRYKNVELGPIEEPDSFVFDILNTAENCIITKEMYKDGIINYKGKNVKIGSFMVRAKYSQKIIDAYAADLFRLEKPTGLYDMVFTGHPLDVYGMSTGRGWTSCADMAMKRRNFDDHHLLAAGKIGNEILSHTHCMYLLPVGGNIDHDAIARKSYKLHKKNDKVSLFPTEMYGIAPHKFTIMSDILVRKLFDIEQGLWVMVDGVYGKSKVNIDRNNKNLTNEQLTNLDLNDFGDFVKNSHPSPELHQYIKDYISSYNNSPIGILLFKDIPNYRKVFDMTETEFSHATVADFSRIPPFSDSTLEKLQIHRIIKYHYFIRRVLYIKYTIPVVNEILYNDDYSEDFAYIHFPEIKDKTIKIYMIAP